LGCGYESSNDRILDWRVGAGGTPHVAGGDGGRLFFAEASMSLERGDVVDAGVVTVTVLPVKVFCEAGAGLNPANCRSPVARHLIQSP